MVDHAPDANFIERHQVSLLLATGIALYGAARFDATRPLAAALLTYGAPFGAVVKGAAPLRESELRNAVLAVAVSVVVSAEVLIAQAFSPSVAGALAALPATPALLGLLVLGAAGAVGVQAAAARRGLRNQFATWVGVATMLGVYLPSHAKVGNDVLGAFIAAFLVSLFVGGGAGLLLGALATRLARAPKSDREPR